MLIEVEDGSMNGSGQANGTEMPNMVLPYHDYYGYVYFCGPLCVLGFITNFLCIAVLSHDKSKVSTSFFLQMLALADNGLLAAMFFTKVLMTASAYHPDNSSLAAYFQFLTRTMYLSNGLTEIFKMYAVLMVVLVTVDRCIAIYFPLQASRLCNLKTATFEVCGLLVYVVIFNMPRFFEMRVIQVYSNITNTTSYTFEPSDMMNNHNYNVIYNTVDSLLNLIIPVLGVFIMNIALIVRLTNARKSRMMMTNASNRNSHSGITLNLVSVVSMFVVCETPIAITTILLAKDMYQGTQSFDMILAHTVSDCFQVFNSFSNFFIYCLVGRKFRRILCDEICCLKKARHLRMSSWSRITAEEHKSGMRSPRLRHINGGASGYTTATSIMDENSIIIPKFCVNNIGYTEPHEKAQIESEEKDFYISPTPCIQMEELKQETI
ncbi:FMRFamide receptor-like [Lineus longissimus]|uniref:FMRFamide receptor-like n=1 Tax=Lineus longissimus TaxID=88925 RepID=UPI00315D6384